MPRRATLLFDEATRFDADAMRDGRSWDPVSRQQNLCELGLG
jgi:hypothetical protein